MSLSEVRAAYHDAKIIETADRGFSVGKSFGALGGLRFKPSLEATQQPRTPRLLTRIGIALTSLKTALFSSGEARAEMRAKAQTLWSTKQSWHALGKLTVDMNNSQAVQNLGKSLDKMIGRVPNDKRTPEGIASHWDNALDEALSQAQRQDRAAMRAGISDLLGEGKDGASNGLTENQLQIVLTIKQKLAETPASSPSEATVPAMTVTENPVMPASVELLREDTHGPPGLPSPLILSHGDRSPSSTPDLVGVPPPPPPSPPASPAPGAAGSPDGARAAQSLQDGINAARLGLKSPPPPETKAKPVFELAAQVAKSGGLRGAEAAAKHAKELEAKAAEKVEARRAPDTPEYIRGVNLLESIRQAGGSPKAASGKREA